MTKPPTSTNITQVARDVRRYFAAGARYYLPSICYRIRKGRVCLTMTFTTPEGYHPLCVLKKHDTNKTSDYQDDICRELKTVVAC